MSALVVGVPSEIKNNENRVSVQPDGVAELVHHGHQVLVQAGAGTGSRFGDAEYAAAGAKVVGTADEVFAWADLIVKVKEPIPAEYHRFREGQQLFTYLHLAADRQLTEFLLERSIDSIAYETVQTPDRKLPLLTPMSAVAGRMSVQAGASFLEKERGGKGVLLGGVPGVRRGRVCIIGGGIVGANAARVAIGLGAQVTVLDINLEVLAYLDDIYEGRIITAYSDPITIEETVEKSDLVVGAVLVAGARAPRLVTEAMIKNMEAGSVIVDVAVDQGGCCETTRPTTHATPTFIEHGIVHYCVANMPGGVARTSTFALNNATCPYVIALAEKGWRQALADDAHLRNGLNVCQGRVTFEAVACDLALDFTPAETFLAQAA